MSAQIKITLSDEAQRIVRNLQRLPDAMWRAIAGAMDQANQFAERKIIQDHLTGIGPYPPEEHKLGRRTGLLAHSVHSSPAVVSGQTVDSSIGSNVIYAAIHEFGGRIHHPARETKVRLRTDARGNLVRQLGHSNLAMFARPEHKRAKEVAAHVGAYDVEMPERAAFRTGIEENKPVYTQKISDAIIAEWDRLKN